MLTRMGAHVQEWAKRYRQDRVHATAEALTLLVQVLAPAEGSCSTMRRHIFIPAALSLMMPGSSIALLRMRGSVRASTVQAVTLPHKQGTGLIVGGQQMRSSMSSRCGRAGGG